MFRQFSSSTDPSRRQELKGGGHRVDIGGGLFYEGSLDADALPMGTGVGLLQLSPGLDERPIFTGEWFRGQPHGRGTMHLLGMPGAIKYVGRFVDGKMNGSGSLHMEDGTVFEGTFAEDRPNSPVVGVLVHADGRREGGELFPSALLAGASGASSPSGASMRSSGSTASVPRGSLDSSGARVRALASAAGDDDLDLESDDGTGTVGSIESALELSSDRGMAIASKPGKRRAGRDRSPSPTKLVLL